MFGSDVSSPQMVHTRWPRNLLGSRSDCLGVRLRLHNLPAHRPLVGHADNNFLLVQVHAGTVLRSIHKINNDGR